ncbi:hypothetical protein [Labrys wisconsinensis]|uniref:Uncharacterized protein n=1 Tax=Labrys wisconsinensis TaxID=425677 RepID=A0ABU0J9I3_9HYPH|nr:hypothetical protein [Labrys wisconsinensis]MDQ0470265.1 hypothetical protein [Labrys wisconsinensis]
MSWLSRLFCPPEAGYDLLADPALAGLSPRALADLPLWPAPEPMSPPEPGRTAPVARPDPAPRSAARRLRPRMMNAA